MTEGGITAVIKATAPESGGFVGASMNPQDRRITFIVADERGASTARPGLLAAHEGFHGVDYTVGKWMADEGMGLQKQELERRSKNYQQTLLSDHPLIKDAYEKDMSKIPAGIGQLGLNLSHYLPSNKGGHPMQGMVGARVEAFAEMMALAAGERNEPTEREKQEYKEIFTHVKGDIAQLREAAIKKLFPRTIAVAEKLHSEMGALTVDAGSNSIRPAVIALVKALPHTLENYLPADKLKAIEGQGVTKLEPQHFLHPTTNKATPAPDVMK